MSEPATPSTNTLESVFAEMQHWRNNKDTLGKSIPDDLWRNVFSLGSKLSEQELRRIFSLNSSQFKQKQQELCGVSTNDVIDASGDQRSTDDDSGTSPPPEAPINFCEATLTHPEHDPVEPAIIPPLSASMTKANLKKLANVKEPLVLDQTTVVVEFIRKDGQRMKIHTKTGSFKQLLEAFLPAQVEVSQ